VDVDTAGRTSRPDVYAIGDCANRPSRYADGGKVRIKSAPNAIAQGKAVAKAIMGHPVDEVAPPWFWSHQYGVKLQTVG
jgi:3-phenylpropionate/trans-cinnamate dioxygenase ferredoxin reductase component